MRAAQHKQQIEIVHINDPFIPVDYMKYMFYVSVNIKLFHIMLIALGHTLLMYDALINFFNAKSLL
jgi:glyceraldehyde 3-phosphate dehydrogenase